MLMSHGIIDPYGPLGPSLAEHNLKKTEVGFGIRPHKLWDWLIK